MKNVVSSTLGMLATLTIASMCVFTTTVLAPDAAQELELDATFIGPFISAVYLVAALSGTLTGSLVARWGAIRVCQLTMFSCTCALFVFASLSTLALIPTLLLSALLLGCAFGPINPASAHVMANLVVGRWQPLLFSVKQLGVPLGGAIAGAATPLLILAFGWRWSAVAIGVLALLPVLLLQPLRAHFDHGDRAPARSAGLRGALALALGEERLRRYALVAFAFAGCQVCAGAFMVVFMVQSAKLSVLDAGGALAVLQVGGGAGRLAWGSVAGLRLSTPVVLAVLGICSSASLILTSQIDAQWTYAQILAVVFVLGTSVYGWNGVLLAQIASLAPPGRSADVTGGTQLVMFGGVVLMPAGFSIMASLTGSYEGAFMALAALSLAGVIGVRGASKGASMGQTR